MTKPNQPRKTARDERAHRNRLLPPAGGSPRVEVSGPQEPEPYFVVGGRERSGWRNALAAARKAHPDWIVAQDLRNNRIEVWGLSGVAGYYLGQTPPSRGPRYQTRTRG